MPTITAEGQHKIANLNPAAKSQTPLTPGNLQFDTDSHFQRKLLICMVFPHSFVPTLFSHHPHHHVLFFHVLITTLLIEGKPIF
jgi:hypothetical protein